MSSVLYYLAIAAVFFVMMRFGCGAHVMGHGHKAHPDREPDPPPAKARDPVCGMLVEVATAKSAMYRGRPYWFCSAEHRDQFEADPARYVAAADGAARSFEEHHHD